jgi:AraC-like DNA-binding protein/mannose-6-phosphate isomerase-like protein (cupin superfamily)
MSNVHARVDDDDPATLAAPRMKMQCPGLRCRAIPFTRARSFPLHVHLSPYVIFVYEGEWTEIAGGVERRLGRGDVLFHPAGVEHETRAAAGTVVALLEISPTILAGFCGLYGFYPRTILTSFDDVERIPERIYAELARADEATTGVVYSLVMQLLAIGSRAPIEANPHAPNWMPRLTAYINANLGERLTVQRLAARAAVSGSHLSHSFVRYFHCSISDYVRECRLRAAARALRHTNDSVEKIAGDFGFSDPAHFSRTFKTERGLTPTQYRTACPSATEIDPAARREPRACCDIR